MYLPVILMRDFGAWSFLVFAAPNCIGAAAMGVLLWRAGASERFLSQHLAACRAFSVVTVVFHLYFLIALIPSFKQDLRVTVAACAVGAVIAALAALRAGGIRAAASVAAFLASITVVVWWLKDAGAAPASPLPAPTEGPLDLLGLSPVCVFGFMLCPYLDLTFHAARQSVRGPAGSRAFLLGFFVLFPALIALTFFYGRHLVALNPTNPLAAVAPLVLAHLIVQIIFTLTLHHASTEPMSARGRTSGIVIFVAALAIVLANKIAPDGWTYDAREGQPGLTAFEITYRLLMACYGLVFPAYVLVCAVGANGFRDRPDRRTWGLFVASVVLAAPFYWMGFIERQTPYLAIGVAIPLIARALVKRPTPPAHRER
ncbi:hypothetical protein PHYC_04001 [Phycisphaerales bacterium]|nr:hypothetical protein PHYC_04001 [Phycisphaerales bacterium]